MPRYGGNPAKGLAPRICEVCGASFQPYRDISACCSSACLKRHPRVRERKNAARRRPEVRARRQAVRKPQDPETARARNLRRYGLTITDFDAMIHEQGGVCAICKRAPSGRGIAAVLHVDHDHTTGIVRGLLCTRCNRALGAFDDDPQRLIDAAAYLRGSGKEG